MTTKPSHLSHPKYRPDIDGLRAVAVLAVVAFHAFPNWVKGGFIGVDVFFVISGYLISTIIFENLDKGTFRFSEFYARRIKRIFPALILVLGACLVFGWFILLADEYKQLAKHVVAGSSFLSNLVLWKEAGYFDNLSDTKPLLHLWSLGIEEQFYIVWPLLVWFSWKRKFNLLFIAIFFATLSFILNVKNIRQDAIATFYSPQTRFWELLSGSVLSWVTLYKNDAFLNPANKINRYFASVFRSDRTEVNGNLLFSLLSLFGLILIVFGLWHINKELNFPGKWALIPVLGATMILIAGPNETCYLVRFD
ncbi:acyltransferase family protein [Polynucleobacter necessarius]|uniref:acyltransferase family protein n=1 Tax=Polynucleobacter necessarius TaxID=576610 RepID=UPI0018D5A178|nr:acyltransferase [Polynucleobacter necessarius]